MPDSRQIAIIVARDRHFLIGRDGQLPWMGAVPSNLARFKRITWDSAVIMGRKTYESIGAPLPGRLNIVVTSDKTFCASVGGVMTAVSVSEALTFAGDLKAFFIGGANIYEAALPLINAYYETIVDGEFDGDVYFPFEAMYTNRAQNPLLWPQVEDHSRTAGLDGDRYATQFTRRIRPTSTA